MKINCNQKDYFAMRIYFLCTISSPILSPLVNGPTRYIFQEDLLYYLESAVLIYLLLTIILREFH